MSDITQTLRRYAREYGIRLDIVEKDYALSYLLVAIAETAGLGDQVALKGGTALKKAYFADYRFSEDLDYSTLNLARLSHLPKMMATVVEKMTERLQERGPFEVQYEPLLLKHPHPGGQAAFLVRVRFPGQRQPLCRLKVEITMDEPVLLRVEERPLLHGFGENLSIRLKVYALTEIVAEKLRALLQSRRRLVERGWGASRVCRDYYDLWEVLTREEQLGTATSGILRHKCALRGVTFASPQDFLAAELQEVACREWGQQLLPFVPHAPPVEHILTDLYSLIPALFQ